jgi:hypothetical protein
MGESRFVKIEIEVDGDDRDSCGGGCPWNDRYQFCKLFNENLIEGEDLGVRCSKCREVEIKE